VFLRAVLPQLRLAIHGGALLIALHLLAEYGLYVLIRFDTLTTAIVDQFQAVYNGPAANLLGIVLVACAIAVLRLEAWLRGDRRYAPPPRRTRWASAARWRTAACSPQVR
jgi:iron(III) transport system permease protein